MKLLLAIVLFSAGLAHAEPLKPKLTALAQEGNESAAILLEAVAEFIGDRIERDLNADKARIIAGRDAEADDILDTLVRMKSKTPVLVAPPGVGKTATVERAIQKTVAKEFPQTDAFKAGLENAYWVQLTPGSLLKIMKSNNELGRMKAIEDFFGAIIEVEKKLKIQIIVFMDELHNLDKAQTEALLPYLESQTKSVRLVGATNGDKLSLAFKDNEAFLRRIRQIGVAEFDDETTLRLVKESWVPDIEKKYEVKFTEDAMKRFIRFGTILNPDGGKFDAAIKIAQDLAIWNQRGPKKAEINQEDLFAFFQEKTKFPVDPFNKDELHKYLQNLEAQIGKQLIGQDRMIHDTVEVFRDVILGTKKDMGVIALVGPSGTGKSELGKLLSRYGFNSPRSFLKIDATEYQHDDSSLNKLFGAPGGLVTSDKRSGIFPDYFDDPSQGKFGGVILIDEAEKASPNFWNRLMEFFEEGQFRGSDGKIRKARRHLVILTSNRGDTILFPEAMKSLSKSAITAHAATIQEKDLKRLFQIKLTGKDEFQIPTSVLNRIDRYSVATPLMGEDIEVIAQNFADKQIAEMEDYFQIKLTVDPAIVSRVASTAFDPQYGARPIERALTRFFNGLKDQLLASPTNFKNAEVDVAENRLSEDSASGTVTIGGKKAFDLELPRIQLDEPLLGTALGEMIERINTIIPKRVIGQDDAIGRVKDVLITYLSTPAKKRNVLGIMLVGLTGVGKTETAKAIAEAIYESPDRAEILPMGEIMHESEFNKVVGSPPGYVGSEQVRAFEQALMNHPEGGVLVFDEATNLGGNDKGLKEALFKRLYNLLEEGKWTSSATGITYNLTKYIFIFTGNDGEHLFRGTTSDQIRLETWKDNRAQGKIHEMLRQRGVPEPFLGRLVDTILMKPLLRAETEEIARKLYEPTLKRFIDLGFELKLPEDFAGRFGKMFFTQQKGARSIRTMAQVRMNAVITEALILAKAQLDQASPKAKKWIDVDIEDNFTKEPYIEDLEYKPKVMLTVQIGAGKEEFVKVERDVTQFAAIDKKLSLKQAEATGYHEAGHAVLNDPEITGVTLKYLTILGSEGNLGFALYGGEEGSQHYKPTDKAKMKVMLARVLAGQIAMVLQGFEPDSGWSSDLRTARNLAQKYVVDWALNKKFMGLLVDDKGEPILSQAQMDEASKEIDAIMSEAVDAAMETLAERWDLVEAVVKKLLSDGFVTEAQYKALAEEWKTKHAAGKPKSSPKNDAKTCRAALIGEPSAQ